MNCSGLLWLKFHVNYCSRIYLPWSWIAFPQEADVTCTLLICAGFQFWFGFTGKCCFWPGAVWLYGRYHARKCELKAVGAIEKWKRKGDHWSSKANLLPLQGYFSHWFFFCVELLLHSFFPIQLYCMPFKALAAPAALKTDILHAFWVLNYDDWDF